MHDIDNNINLNLQHSSIIFLIYTVQLNDKKLQMQESVDEVKLS